MYDTLTVPPAKLAVSKDLMSSHLKMEITDIGYFEFLMSSITESFESDTCRDLITKTYEIYLDNFDGLSCLTGYRFYYEKYCKSAQSILIKKTPLQSIEKIEYLVDDVWTTVSTDVYRLCKENIYSFIDLEESQGWPSNADDVCNNVRITIKAGYGDTCADVPNDIKWALMAIYASLDQNRGDCIDSANTVAFNLFSNIPPQAQAVITKYAIQEIMIDGLY